MSIGIPIIGFVGWSGSGKTTLLTKVLPVLQAHGVRVGVIKHTHHNVEFDTPGKDSHRLRVSGASQMLVTSARRWAIYADKPATDDQLDIYREAARLNIRALDIILVESFKNANIPKIELYRPAQNKPLLYPGDPNIVAIACNEALDAATGITVLNLNQPEQIAWYILEYL